MHRILPLGFIILLLVVLYLLPAVTAKLCAANNFGRDFENQLAIRLDNSRLGCDLDLGDYRTARYL